MDRVSRCLHCGKRMVPITSSCGRTELRCIFCEELDPMEMTAANKWADSPLATPISETAHKRAGPQQAFRRDVPTSA